MVRRFKTKNNLWQVGILDRASEVYDYVLLQVYTPRPQVHVSQLTETSLDSIYNIFNHDLKNHMW